MLPERPAGRRSAREYRRRRLWLVPLFLAPLLAGVALVSVGMELAQLRWLGFTGYLWAMTGLGLIAAASGLLGFLSRCPVCGKALPLTLIQGHAGESCPSCGSELG